jgi:hypothetical protein
MRDGLYVGGLGAVAMARIRRTRKPRNEARKEDRESGWAGQSSALESPLRVQALYTGGLLDGNETYYMT